MSQSSFVTDPYFGPLDVLVVGDLQICPVRPHLHGGNWGNDFLFSADYGSTDTDLLDGGKHEDECYFNRSDDLVRCEKRVER